MRHVISAIVENKPGVLAHIAGLFSSRGFNIDSLAVGVTEDANLSRMTIVVKGDDAILEQVRKQLGKVIDVLKVSDFSSEDYVEREHRVRNLEAREVPEVVELSERRAFGSAVRRRNQHDAASALRDILHDPVSAVLILLGPEVQSGPVPIPLHGSLRLNAGGRRQQDGAERYGR